MKTKFIAEYTRKATLENGNTEITIEVDSKYFKMLHELEKGVYSVEFCKKGNNRSINQNSLLWALINEICKVTGFDDIELYCQLLEMANAKFEYMMVLPQALDLLKKQFRATKVVENRVYNDVDMLMVKVFYGSSTFTTKEMGQLIDITLNYASEYDIDTTFYKELYEC